MTAPTFPPEHFSDWTLRERRPGCWSLTNVGGDEEYLADFEVDLSEDAGVEVARLTATPPIAGIERLLELRRQAIEAVAPPRNESREAASIRAWGAAFEDLAQKPTAAASVPPSIADDLGTPEPGSFEGADVVASVPSQPSGIEEAARRFLLECPEFCREQTAAAVRDALAELRGELANHREPGDASERYGYVGGMSDAIAAIDRIAARFQ